MRWSGWYLCVALGLGCGRPPSVSEGTSTGEGSSGASADTGTEGAMSESSSGTTATDSTVTSSDASESDGEVSTDGEGTGPVLDIDDRPLLDMGSEPECEAPPAASLSAQGSQIPDACAAIDIEGFVLAADGASFTVDACPCDWDCAIEDPQDFELDAPAVEGEFFALVPGQCVRVRGLVHDACDATYLNVTEVDPVHPECGLLAHYSNSRLAGGGPTAQYADDFPGVEVAFEEDGESCSTPGMGRHFGSLSGTAMDLPFDVPEGETLETEACWSSFVEYTLYEVTSLAAQSTTEETTPGTRVLAELLIRRNAYTIPPP